MQLNTLPHLEQGPSLSYTRTASILNSVALLMGVVLKIDQLVVIFHSSIMFLLLYFSSSLHPLSSTVEGNLKAPLVVLDPPIDSCTIRYLDSAQEVVHWKLGLLTKHQHVW